MKKVIALLLVFIIVLALCGCGTKTQEAVVEEDNTETMADILSSELWYSLYSGTSIRFQFFETGTGQTLKENGNIFFSFTWTELDENTFRMEYQYLGTKYVFDYVFENLEGVYTLSCVANADTVLIRESDYTG